MNDEELDRELKRVKLLREQLALEKELKRNARQEDVMRTARNFRSTVVAASASILKVLFRFLRRWWKVGAIGAGVSAVVIGGFSLHSHLEEEKKKAAEEEYWGQAWPYIDKICRPIDCSGWAARSHECTLQYIDYDSCKSNALKNFDALLAAKKDGTFPPAPTFKIGDHEKSEAPMGEDESNITPGVYYNNSLASAAFPDYESAHLWLTHIMLAPNIESPGNTEIKMVKGSWRISIAPFLSLGDAKSMQKKLAKEGLETELLHEPVDLNALSK